MTNSPLSSPSMTSSHFGVISASDTASQSDSDYEVVLVAQTAAALNISDSDSGSLVSIPTDFAESSDDEQIFVENITQASPNAPRPPSVGPRLLTATPRPTSAVVARPVIESGHDSEASDREDGSSLGSSYDSESDNDDVVHARARTVTVTNPRLEAPVSASASTATLMAHPNASSATIRPTGLTRPASIRRSAPAGMHTPAITTNTIAGIVSAVPLSPLTPSDAGEIPYVSFTAAPTAVSVPITASPLKPSPAPVKPKKSAPTVPEPTIPTGKVTRKVWATMNIQRLKLGFKPLEHALRKQRNAELKTKGSAAQQKKADAKPKAQAKPKRSKAAKAATASMVGGSPVTSEDEAPRMRASMFSSNGTSMRSESPDDEAAYDAAIQQLNELSPLSPPVVHSILPCSHLSHMSSPPEHPTATYRYILNRALLLEFRICTPDTLPTSHGAAIAMVKSNIHINVLDYVAKRKEGFSGLRSVMLENAKALRKDVKKRKMPVKQVKSLGLNSLLIQRH
ncbi:hypothetical protein RhiJN_14229 [Ceratobasidium sp. AG-Ba]|nr:hypothetical protein RhiJN_14229 [Ceratobasidium sp. AG-Ba]